MINYADNTFSIDWWGEILYCKSNDEFLDHLALLKDKFKSKKHQAFKNNEANKFEKFQEKVEEIRKLAGG